MEVLVLELICACAVTLTALSVAHAAYKTQYGICLSTYSCLVLLVVGNLIVVRWSCLGLLTTAFVIAW